MPAQSSGAAPARSSFGEIFSVKASSTTTLPE